MYVLVCLSPVPSESYVERVQLFRSFPAAMVARNKAEELGCGCIHNIVEVSKAGN